MLIGYGQPALVPSVDGAAAINLAALVDGRPSSVARITGGIGSVRLRADWDVAAPVRIVAALGLTCPVGTALQLTGKRASDADYTFDLGGNAATQTVVELVDGSRAAWFVLPAGNAALVGLQLQVTAGEFDVGELVVLQGVDVAIEKDWESDRIDPSTSDRTLGGGINVVPRRSYRRLRCTPAAEHIAGARGGALDNGMDWERLTFAVQGSARLAAIPRWGHSDVLDTTELHRTALYGRAIAGAIAHAGGNYYNSGTWTFEEVPPL